MKKLVLLLILISLSNFSFGQHPTNLVISNITSNSAELSWDNSICNNNSYLSYKVTNDNNWIVVSTKEEQHKFVIEEVLNEKGQNVVGDVKVGERLNTPSTHLEKAKSIRSKFDSKGLKK